MNAADCVARLAGVSLRYGQTRAVDDVTLEIPAASAAEPGWTAST